MLVFLLGLGRHCLLHSTQKFFLRGCFDQHILLQKNVKNGCGGGLNTLHEFYNLILHLVFVNDKNIRLWWAFTFFTIFLKHYPFLASLVSEVEKDGTATRIFLFLYFKKFINCVSPCVNIKIYWKKFEHFVWKWHYGNWRGGKFSQNTITPQYHSPIPEA